MRLAGPSGHCLLASAYLMPDDNGFEFQLVPSSGQGHFPLVPPQARSFIPRTLNFLLSKRGKVIPGFARYVGSESSGCGH